MKKIVLTIAIALIATISHSQSREKGTFELIPQIGYGSANYVVKGSGSGNSPISSVGFGLGADYFFNNRWSLRTGILYQTMGSEYGGVFKDELKYVTLPLNANWHFGSTRKWNLNFGPSIGFLTSANTNGVDTKELVNTTQFGINYGIGYKIEVSEQISILIDYQAMSGLSRVAKNNSLSFVNIYGSFNAGCVFKL